MSQSQSQSQSLSQSQSQSLSLSLRLSLSLSLTFDTSYLGLRWSTPVRASGAPEHSAAKSERNPSPFRLPFFTRGLASVSVSESRGLAKMLALLSVVQPGGSLAGL